MSSKREITEARLNEALQRLLEGNPVRTKNYGSITLNKINLEAGLGNSYIHKFPRFVEYAKPVIEKYNQTRMIGEIRVKEIVALNDKEKFQVELQRERRLKERYRQERDDARKAKEEIESLANSLMFRLHDLQQELKYYKVTLMKK